ncbi:MAG: hypothetical protein SGBAC_007002 [Bacillariaceae sp.]
MRETKYNYPRRTVFTDEVELVQHQRTDTKSELHPQHELEAQQRQHEEEQRIRLQQIQEIREAEHLEHLYLGEGRPPKNPFDVFKNWRACFGKLFRPQEQECNKIDRHEDYCYLNATAPRQPKRHECLFSNIQPEEEELYYR